ncbi:MAG: GNAT family N-acetyltransferase [Pseudodesulfovibrio sp.]|uniref:GCN5-related N-acetyltransferase n=1 Tax=Pseudodesulfovibrio aespoeensis (strain ATCC 700646 / DSM 10631 / Aspo-2) TaxID=643562 RepID=E6VUP7_PSEA9|nr:MULTISPECIES: GNAT family N-acetyltransferase [Pseudodesulfovibrio]MBU4193307.1 GNAT family N-acetyltransferase [Pseudomonadota bacterium]ADU62288.1 GCN5-related N-acetyltransferase [Pseudodesulfovibrio aespoeensis Aspo-2]MBU4243338.1 GNAT family N-acetyltransferase [Pseudomonadota bacterium]MBU4380504.1 GNAT family N-acetyltransferase [Pseudomonadota bacterium]MBU4474047.1 GNAT family N-acetyltransferase [Pseudomonadota bacterium]
MRKHDIRTATRTDIEAISRLYENLLHEWNVPPGDDAARGYLHLLERQLEQGAVFIAERDGTLAGAMSYIDAALTQLVPEGRAHLTSAVVVPAHRRRGIASALLHAIASNCRRLGIRRITTDCARDNTAALGLLMRQGFREYDETSRLNQTPADIFLEIDTEMLTAGGQDGRKDQN